METPPSHHHSYASHRSLGMALALVSAIVLSPIYLSGGNRRHERKFYECSWWTLSSSGFFLPVVVAGLVIAIRTASSSSSTAIPVDPTLDTEGLVRVGSSSWGLAGILVFLLVLVTWQSSIQKFFWK